MHPVLSIGIYLIFQLITLLQIRWCIHRESGDIRKNLTAKRRYLLFACLYMLAALLPVAGAMLPECRPVFALQAAGNLWMGFYVYFGGLLLFLWIILALAEQMIRKKSRALRLGILAVSLCTGIGLFAYGTIHAQHTVIKRYDLEMEKRAGDLSGLRVVLIADLHLSVNSYLSTTEKMVEMINGEEPDVVLIAGDIFTSCYEGLKDPVRYAQTLRQIRAKYGVYAVYGNHDVEETLFGGFPISPISRAFRTAQMEQFFRDSGFTVLYDETALIADGAVQIAGRVDGEKAGDGTALRKSPGEVLADTDPEKPVIVLEHEPVEFAALKENGADLALCGHTHAGQIWPGNLIVPFFNENAYGYRRVGGLDTVVTSGVGYYGPPMRVGTNSEVTVIDLHFADS